MRLSTFVIAASVSTAFAQRDCEAIYDKCVASGEVEVKCSCDRTACYGEDAARIREWCSSAIANATRTATSTAISTSSRLIITGTPGSQPPGQTPITAAEGSLLLGETCSDDRQCANGVECWGSHSGIIRRCGNFNAGCSNDSQCAYNTCNNGLCNGFLPSSTFPAATQSKASSNTTSPPTTATGALPAPSPTIVAANGTIPLGSPCSNTAQCASGAECWASNMMIQMRCGNFNAACKSDAQCAYHSCNNGLCNGFINPNTTTTPAPTPSMFSRGLVRRNDTSPLNETSHGNGTSSVPYTGTASVAGALSGFLALVAGIAAYLL